MLSFELLVLVEQLLIWFWMVLIEFSSISCVFLKSIGLVVGMDKWGQQSWIWVRILDLMRHVAKS